MKKSIISCLAIAPIIALAPVSVIACSSSDNKKPEGGNEKPEWAFMSYETLKKVTSEIPHRKATNKDSTKNAIGWIKRSLKEMGYRGLGARDFDGTTNVSSIGINGTTTAKFNTLSEQDKKDDLNHNGFFENKFSWNNGTEYACSNIMLNIPSSKANAKDVFIVSHYDTANEKNDGTNDNSSGLATSLAIAKYFSQQSKNNLNVNLHILFAGAEEEGVIGTNVWVNQYLVNNDELKNNTLWMINLDSVAGGDKLYVHSPNTKIASQGYELSSQIRDELNKLSNNQLEIHPQIDPQGFKKGETGDWSDHAPFYKNGIKIAYIESTNFNIKGQDGYDGYSQTINEQYWKKADGSTVKLIEQQVNGITVYVPENYDELVKDKTFTSWGKLWHMDDDIFSRYESNFPGRLKSQMSTVFETLINYIINQK